ARRPHAGAHHGGAAASLVLYRARARLPDRPAEESGQERYGGVAVASIRSSAAIIGRSCSVMSLAMARMIPWTISSRDMSGVKNIGSPKTHLSRTRFSLFAPGGSIFSEPMRAHGTTGAPDFWTNSAMPVSAG